MMDLNGHEAGNGGHSQGKSTVHRVSSTRRSTPVLAREERVSPKPIAPIPMVAIRIRSLGDLRDCMAAIPGTPSTPAGAPEIKCRLVVAIFIPVKSNYSARLPAAKFYRLCPR